MYFINKRGKTEILILDKGVGETGKQKDDASESIRFLEKYLKLSAFLNSWKGSYLPDMLYLPISNWLSHDYITPDPIKLNETPPASEGSPSKAQSLSRVTPFYIHQILWAWKYLTLLKMALKKPDDGWALVMPSDVDRWVRELNGSISK